MIPFFLFPNGPWIHKVGFFGTQKRGMLGRSFFGFHDSVVFLQDPSANITNLSWLHPNVWELHVFFLNQS
jgi:hypothetical protein